MELNMLLSLHVSGVLASPPAEVSNFQISCEYMQVDAQLCAIVSFKSA